MQEPGGNYCKLVYKYWSLRVKFIAVYNKRLEEDACVCMYNSIGERDIQ